MKCELTAKRIKHALDMNDIKAQDLADKSGVKKASISQYVNGTHAPSNMSSAKMAAVLGVDPLWLMGFDVPMLKNTALSARSADPDGDFFDKYRLLDAEDKRAVEVTVDTLLRNAKYQRGLKKDAAI